MWDTFNQRLKMAAKPGATDPDHPADPPMGDPFGQQLIHQRHLFSRNGRSKVVKRKLMTTNPTQIALLAGMGVAVFDDADSAAVRTVKLVHGLFNPYRA